MSRETIQAIEDAVKAHVAEVEEEGLVLADFLVVYTGSHLIEKEDEPGLEPCYHTSYTTNDGSNPITTIGLARWMDSAVEGITGEEVDDEHD